MDVLSIIASFVFVGAAGWVLNKILTDMFEKYKERKKIQEDKNGITEETSVKNPDQDTTSRFATSRKELEDVLELRRSFFGSQPVAPDDAYRKCWQRNKYSMKIVYSRNEQLGYWSVIPVSHDSFQNFLEGKISHADMITKHCKSWCDIQPGELYLYIIGIVVPPSNGISSRESDWGQKYRSGKVIYDLYSFALELDEKVTIQGACGYPSEPGGYALLEHVEGFQKSSTLIDGDENQPVFILKEPEVPLLHEYLRKKLRKKAHRVSKWEDTDRQDFFSMIEL